MVDICLSGGAAGADTLWGQEARSAGHYCYHLGFEGMKSKCEIYKLSEKTLRKADEHIIKANKTLKRGDFNQYTEYTKNLLRRNYFQVENSDTVYAVGEIGVVGAKGGTGWAIQIAADLGKEIYFFDQNFKGWYKYTEHYCWVLIETFPKPCGIYAGIGTRKLTEVGEGAIRSLFLNGNDVKVVS